MVLLSLVERRVLVARRYLSPQSIEKERGIFLSFETALGGGIYLERT
jgi:hypothetical protein